MRWCVLVALLMLVLRALTVLVGIAWVWLLFDIHGGSADRGGSVARGAVACVHCPAGIAITHK